MADVRPRYGVHADFRLARTTFQPHSALRVCCPGCGRSPSMAASFEKLGSATIKKAYRKIADKIKSVGIKPCKTVFKIYSFHVLAILLSSSSI